MKKTFHAAFGAAMLAVAPLSGALAQNISTTLINNEGQVTGEVTIMQAPKGVMLDLSVENLSSGWHGVHIHETGDCTDLETFATAGGHFAMEGQAHGFKTEDGPHAGDFPNMWVSEAGEGHINAFNPGLDLEDLQDEDGSALIIHSGADDYESQPSGDAGSRVACALLTAGE